MLVLVRITNAYTKPTLDLIPNPWELLSAGTLRLRSNLVLPASFISMKHQPKQETSNRFTIPSSHSHRGSNTHPSNESASDVSDRQHVQDNTTTSPCPSITQPERHNEPDTSPAKPREEEHVTRSPEAGSSQPSVDRKRKRSPELDPNSRKRRLPAKRAGSVASTHHSYPYTKLQENQIRLFTLFPGDVTQRLHGMLWSTTSKMAGAYTTLSYVWGPEDQPTHVMRTPLGDISIRQALYVALVNLRQKREPLTLWVDALCINQSDELEKARQITLLAEIFQRSTSTVAFIGGEEDHSDAIQMLMQVRACMVLGPSSEEWPEHLPRCPSLWEERGMPFPDDDTWASVAAFFANPWFRRAWIVQEAVIARRLQIVHGKTWVDWNHLFLAMVHIDKELETTQRNETDSWIPFLKLGRLRHIEDRSGRVSILKLLENFRHAKSSDPRDKFFSLLGIASDGNLEDFEPDYSTSLAEVIQRFATSLFRRFSEEKQSMLILYRAGLSQSDDLPSWVPDWLVEKPSGLHDALGRGTAFEACGDLMEQIKCVPDTDELDVEASLVDEVEYVSESCNGVERSEQRRYFTEVKELVEAVFGGVLDEEKIRRVIWEAPIAGARHPKIALPGDVSIYDSWQAFARLLKLEWIDDENEVQEIQSFQQHLRDESESALEAKSRVYQSLLADEVRGWRFITFKERNLCGIAPNIVQKGDILHIFHGGIVPFITRRSEEREGAYRLIGQCYIWGMMQGEGIRYDGLIKETVRLH